MQVAQPNRDACTFRRRLSTILIFVCVLQGYQELKVPLSDIAVNPYTVSELVRLCLRKDDRGSANNEDDNEDDDDQEVVSVLTA
jgi:hypothetical protein